MNIVFTESDRIEAFDTVATLFFDQVLQMAYAECFVSDASSLSDFSSCGLPEALSENASGLPELYDRWDAWVIQEIDARYGVKLESTRITLVDLFAQIEAAARQTLH